MSRYIAVLLSAACIHARAQSSGEPAIRVNVQEVLVPVIVTDSKGHHVTGLKASDFRVQEDGVAQDLASFSTATAAGASAGIASSEPTAGAPARTAPADSPRHTFVICVDTLHTAFAGSVRTREALGRLFGEEKPGAAQYVLVGIGRQLQVLQNATRDPAAVLCRLRSRAFQPALGGGDAAALNSELSDLKNRMYDFCRRCPACGARANYRACDGEAQDLKTSLDAQAARWGALTGQLLAQLKSVVEELAKLPTGRTLILVSDGFSLQPAREFYGVAAAFLSADPRFKMNGPVDLAPDLQAVIKVAVERNVRIYAVDSRGVAQTGFAGNGSMDASAPTDRSAQSVIARPGPSSNRGGTLFSDMDHEASTIAFQNSAPMEQLARTTGGVYFHNSNEMLKQFRSALADGREYYVLGYVPKNRTDDGRFRAITVEVKEKKLNLRAKTGYWAESPPN